MDILSKDTTTMFFKKAIRKDSGSISMDGEMIRLLVAIDENKSISRIGEDIGMNPAVLKETVLKLVKMGVIEPVARRTNFLSGAFLKELTINLTHAVGPMSEFLIEDTVSAMGLAVNEIPLNRAPELISMIAEGIPDDTERANFKKKMVGIMPKERI